MFVALVAAEFIGNVTVPLGITDVVLYPLLWALLIGLGMSVAHRLWPGRRQQSVVAQVHASHFVQAAILLVVAKLGFIIGGSLSVVADAGVALVLQEAGNFFGSILIALPVAILLGIKREAVGATFSIGREVSMAVVAERYGMTSAEGRGVMAEYVTGTVLGALFIAVLAGAVAGLGIFDPRALAMGAGIGSGSMMAAGVGAVITQFPERSQELAALAAASNLITTAFGTYFIMFVTLPLTSRLYAFLEPRISPAWSRRPAAATPAGAATAEPVATGGPDGTSLRTAGAVIVLSGAAALIGNWIASGTPPGEALAGVALTVAVALLGIACHAATRRLRIPLVFWVSLFGILATAPFSPTSAIIAPLAGKVGFLPLVTPALAFAGLALAKDLPMLRRLGWRIVVVSLLANAGAFLAGSVIAELAL